MKRIFGILFAAGVASSAALAIEGTSESTSNRMNDRLGGYVSLFGDPYPATFGANVAYNVYDFLRVNGGVGTDRTNNVSATSFGIGAKAMVPGWPLTPIAGINWANTSVPNNSNVRGIQSGNHFYANAGLDWQTTFGVNIGAGWNQPLVSNASGLVYLNAGFFL